MSFSLTRSPSSFVWANWRDRTFWPARRFSACISFSRLRPESLPLVDRVSQLGERVGIFAAEDDELEPLDESGVVIARPRQGRDLDRVVGDEGRLAKLGLDVFFEKIVELLADRLPARVLQHQVGHALAAQRRREIDLLALICDLRRAPRGRTC